MNKKNDIRAGYRVPNGYFEDFSARMAVMSANTKPIPKRRSVFKLLVFTASAAAAMIALVFVIFGRYADNTDDILLSVPSEVVVTQYFGATESDVVNYFLTEQPSESISDEDVLEYLSSSGMVNLYALMDY